MDFEFNQCSAICSQRRDPGAYRGRRADPVRPRQGRHQPAAVPVPVGHHRRRSQCVANNATPCWGQTRVNLTTAGDALRARSTPRAIPAAEADGLGAISHRAPSVRPRSTSTPSRARTNAWRSASAYLKSAQLGQFPGGAEGLHRPADAEFLAVRRRCRSSRPTTPPRPALLDGAEFDLLADNAPVGTAPGAEDTLCGFVHHGRRCLRLHAPCSRATTGSWRPLAPTGHSLAEPGVPAGDREADDDRHRDLRRPPPHRGDPAHQDGQARAAAEGGVAPRMRCHLHHRRPDAVTTTPPAARVSTGCCSALRRRSRPPGQVPRRGAHEVGDRGQRGHLRGRPLRR